MTDAEWITLIRAKTQIEWYAAMEALKLPRGGKYPNEISTHAKVFAALFERLS